MHYNILSNKKPYLCPVADFIILDEGSELLAGSDIPIGQKKDDGDYEGNSKRQSWFDDDNSPIDESTSSDVSGW